MNVFDNVDGSHESESLFHFRYLTFRLKNRLLTNLHDERDSKVIEKISTTHDDIVLFSL